jgi:ABC-type branched-subunit amino acid transport system permease subunit
MIAIAVHPVGPPQVTALLNPILGEGVPGLPVLLIGVLAGGLLYVVLGWIVLRRRAGTYRLRGM